MSPIIHLYRELHSKPRVPQVSGMSLSSFEPQHLDAWLELFRCSFAQMDPPVRPWTREDFWRLIGSHPWWRQGQAGQLVWFQATGQLIASAILGQVQLKSWKLGTLHWLMVHPRWRRQGVGRMVLRAVEAAAWDQGLRWIRAETHRRWTAAVQFYQKQGYRPATLEGDQLRFHPRANFKG